jgi:hypothetical protein
MLPLPVQSLDSSGDMHQSPIADYQTLAIRHDLTDLNSMYDPELVGVAARHQCLWTWG